MRMAPPIPGAIVVARAAHAAAIEIAQPAGILDGLPDRARVYRGCLGLADVGPEAMDAEAEGDDRVEKGDTEQAGHGAVRHHAVEGTSLPSAGPERRRICRGDEAED